MAENDTPTDDTSGDQQQSDDAKASDQSTDDTQQGDQQQAKPIEYEAFKLPEGQELNEEVMGEFTKLAKEAGLPQDKAQSLVDLGAKMAKGFGDSAEKSLNDFKEGFATSLKNDTELGGENLDANLGIAQRAIDTYGNAELKEMLTQSGLDKHPELVRFFHNVGKTIAEDNELDNAGQEGGAKSLAERMYGKEQAA